MRHKISSKDNIMTSKSGSRNIKEKSISRWIKDSVFQMQFVLAFLNCNPEKQNDAHCWKWAGGKKEKHMRHESTFAPPQNWVRLIGAWLPANEEFTGTEAQWYSTSHNWVITMLWWLKHSNFSCIYMTSSFLLLFIYFFTLEFGKTSKGFPDNSIMEHLTFQKAAINFNPMESFI